jgi:hypothetical protein
MVNKKNWLGILVIALVFGMTVVGNLEAQTDNGGEFILTDLPAKYNGKFAVLNHVVSEDNADLFYCMTTSSFYIATLDEKLHSFIVPIIGGKAIFPLWVLIYDGTEGGKLEKYSGNDYLAIFINIIEKKDVNSKILEKIEFNKSEKLILVKNDRIKFSNGIATGSYKNKSKRGELLF